MGGLDVEDAFADLEQGHVERAAAEVEDEHRLLFVFLVEPVGQGSRRRLVDDAQHLEAGDLTGFLCCLALGVTEVRGDGDDRLRYRVAEVGLCVPLQLRQDLRTDLLRDPLLPVDVDGPVLAHVPFDRADRPVRVRDRLALRDLADEDLAALGERDDRRGRACALRVGDNGGLSAFEDRDH